MKIRNLLCAGLFSAAALAGAITNVQTAGVTNTQVVLKYDAPDSKPCSLAVSESPALAPLVHDVDPALFANANLDSRAGNLSSSRQRTFVVGRRSAEVALDGSRYSRALQALTPHYYQITCPSTGDTYSGQFQTANLMMGNTYTEPEPVDPAHPGEYAWPTINFSDRSQQIVDPQTGVLIRHLSAPSDRTITQPNQGQSFYGVRSQSWTNPSAALSNLDNNAAAAISGNSTAALLLLPHTPSSGGYSALFRAGHGSNLYFLNWFQVVINASTATASCNSSAADNCKIVVCLTLDGVNCASTTQSFEQPLTTTLTNYTFGTQTPIDLWQTPGNRPFNGTEIATRNGSVNCDGSANVTYAGGDYFATNWTPGSIININGADFTIASHAGFNSITLTSSCPAAQGASYAASNFGVLIRKKTASADSVAVQYASINYQLGVFPFWTFTGAFDICGPTPVAGPTGNPGYNCVLQQNAPIYWVDSLTGEAHEIARYMSGPTPASGGCGGADAIIFDAINPDIWYCSGQPGIGNPQYPQRVHYFGNHSEPQNTQYPGRFEEGENLPSCNSSENPTNQPCLTYSSLTGSVDMGTLTASFDPAFQADRFPGFYLVGVENGLLVFRVWRGGHNSIGWTVLFDPNATANKEPNNVGCVGGGQPGCVVGAYPTWKRPGSRWCPLKGNDPLSQPGWMAQNAFIWGPPGDTNPGEGPYVSTIADGTSLAAGAGVPGGLNSCPPNALNVTGQQCTTVTIDGEPRDPSPCTASVSSCNGALETGAPGEIGAAAPGDEFTIGPAAGNSEILRLLSKSGNSWTFQRGVNGLFQSASPNAALYAFCSANPNPLRQGIANGDWYWNYAQDPHGYNATGNTVLGDNYSINAHFFFQNGVQAVGYTVDPRCNYGPGYNCYQTRVFSSIPQYVVTPPAGIVTEDGFFGGKYGPADPNQVQQHPSGPGLSSNQNERQYFYDGRPFNGSYFAGSTNGDGANPAFNLSGNLYKFPASSVQYMDRKFLPTFAFAGYRPLLDVSAPGSVLGGAAADSFKYCVAAAAGECGAGSSVGDVYFNIPFLSRAYCHYPGQASPMPDEYDACFGNNAMPYNSIMQNGVAWVDNYGTYQRALTKALARNHLVSPFWHVHALANARWMLVISNYAENIGDIVLLVKTLPPPPQDSVNRGNFVPLQVTVKPSPGMKLNNAYIEFGYSEWGSATQYFCTSRAETCAVGRAASSAQVDPVNPFIFETTESALLTGAPCAAGCTIAVPAVSQRVLYARVVYRNAANAVISRGAPFALAVP